MSCTLLQKCKQCSAKLVADGHQARYGHLGGIGRPVHLAKRTARNVIGEATASAVWDRVAGLEQTVARPTQAMPRGTSSAQPPLRHTEVEVHLSVSYKCSYGSRVAVIGSQQGWQTSAATPMAWSAGDVWSTVLTLPVGSDVEYKYIVIDESGSVIRWQEGSNEKLSLRDPGYLLHVTDSWAQDRRQVHEIGLPVAAAAPLSSSQPPSSSSSRRVLEQNAGRSSRDSSSRTLQNNIARFSRPSAGREAGAATTFSSTAPPPPPPAAAAAAVAQSPSEHKDLQQKEKPKLHLQLDVLVSSAQNTTMRQHPDAVTPTSSSSRSKSSNRSSSSDRLSSLLKQQQEQVAVPSHLAVNINELLPLLQNELASALDALSSCSTAQEASSSGLLADGQAVLDVINRQLDVSKQAAGTTVGGSSAAQQQNSTVTSISRSSRSPQPAAVVPGANAAVTQLGTTPHTTPTPNSSSSRVSKHSRSPGSTLASEDDIAAALLSDDCEEACYCLVDAICSCMGSEAGLEECCDVQYKDDEDVKVHSELLQTHSAAVGAPGAVTAAADALAGSRSSRRGVSSSAAMLLNPAAAAATAAAAAAAAAEAARAAEQVVLQSVLPAATVTAASSAVAAEEEAIAAEQLALRFTEATAAAAVAAAPEVDAATRAAAFAGVQRALDHSAQLLESLSDPTHPMMLAADREVAVARHQLGLLLPA